MLLVMDLNGSKTYPYFFSTLDPKDHELWDRTVRNYLEDSLWTEELSYDAGHFLMVPLHAAFLNNETQWQYQLSRHFHKFAFKYPKEFAEVRLNRLHYLYLASRFIVLAKQTGKGHLIPSALPQIIYSEIENLWIREPAWQWHRKPFGNMRERVSWKLSLISPEKSYYRAIIDEELFVFAIAADLAQYEWLSFRNTSPLLIDIVSTALKVFRQEMVYQDGGGWLFQPYVWVDHPDHFYACHREVSYYLEPCRLPQIAWDSSHSHRFPLWLSSLSEGALNSQARVFFLNLKRGLEKQLFNHVLVPPTSDFPWYRMRNFMDGRNGVYRYNHETLAKGEGYGPYEASGTLLIGWWTFLDTQRIRNVYSDLSRGFPLSQDLLKIYFDKSRRTRHPIVRDSLTNGFRELIVRLSSKLNRSVLID